MLRYNLILALRSLFKRKFISLVIIIGLTIGFVCTFYIIGFSYNELTVDNFNQNRNLIYQLSSDDPWIPGKKIAMIVDGAPQYIRKTYPEVTDYCQIANQSIDKVKIGQNAYFSEFGIIEASPSFFAFFPFPLISGNVKNVLSTNQMVVVSKKFALKYFGNINVIGKLIEMDINGSASKEFIVSGVVDNSKINSHLTFDMVISNVNKDIRGTVVYLMLDKLANADELEKKFIKDKKQIPALFNDIPLNYYLQDLKSVYFEPLWGSRIIKSRNIQYIYIAIIIGILLYLIALFNYINLVYYQLIDRIKEILIKKVIGARLIQSGRQLVSECFLLIGISVILSLILLKQFFYILNRLTESDYSIADFFHPLIILISLSIILFTGFLSLLIIVRFIRRQKSEGLLSSSKTPDLKRQNIPLLTVFQFAASVILIASTLTILKQVSYIHNKGIGLDKSVVEIRLGTENGKKSQAFRDELLKNPVIKNVSVNQGSPMHGGAMLLINYVDEGVKKMYSPLIYSGDDEYFKILGLKLLSGELFSTNPKNNANKCIVNKALVDFFNMKDPIGKLLPGTDTEIIGITDNFIWRTLDSPFEPAYINYTDNGNVILVKINPAMLEKGINYIKQCWAKLIPDNPIEFSTIGDQFNIKHQNEEHLVDFITTFCLLSIFISIMGLFAFSLFSIQRRIKEIGIRKVNGATIMEIAIMLNKNLIKWILLAILIATPLTWYAMHKWLENFAYKTELSWWIFALAGLLAFLVALLTVSWQSWRAAMRNPVEALRYE